MRSRCFSCERWCTISICVCGLRLFPRCVSRTALLFPVATDCCCPVSAPQRSPSRRRYGLRMPRRGAARHPPSPLGAPRFPAPPPRPRALRPADAGARRGAASAVAAGVAVFAAQSEAQLDYFDLVDPVTFARITDDARGDAGSDALALVAARVGSVRLIDNARIALG